MEIAGEGLHPTRDEYSLMTVVMMKSVAVCAYMCVLLLIAHMYVLMRMGSPQRILGKTGIQSTAATIMTT